MRRHEREVIVSNAKMDIDSAILAIEGKYELTFGELVSILGLYLATSAKYQIRIERHGDASKPGGLE
jgi:hypothetical protein